MLMRFVAGACAAALIPIFAMPAAAGPTAAEILKRVQALADGAKTYQATIIVNTNAGKQGTMSLRLDIKTSGNKGSLATSLVGQPIGELARRAVVSSMQIVDDGQSTWLYNAGAKTYARRPSNSGKNARSAINDMAKLTKDSTLTLAAPERIGGKRVYVIQAIPKKAGLNQPEKETLYIEQDTFHLRQKRVITRTRSGGTEGPTRVLTTMLVQNERFNAPIPDSAFRFVPPAGAKEMETGGMMGGSGMRIHVGPVGPGHRK